MDKNIIELLVNAGWNKDRNIEISTIEKKLNEKGYCLFEETKSFLKQYGMLKIQYENPRLKGYILTMDLDPVNAAESVSRDLVKDYETYFNDEMFTTVGEIERENMTIYMTNKGNFYGGFDDCVLKLGESFDETLFNLVNGVKLDLIIVTSE